MAGRPTSCRWRMARCSSPMSRTARSTASPTRPRAPAGSNKAMRIGSEYWRPPVLGLTAAVFCSGLAFAQAVPLAERIELCGACHGEDGNSRMENIPSLAGQPDFFVVNQLFLMREGVRKIEAMAPIVKELKDEEMGALAKHYAKLAPKPSGEPIDAALVKRGGEIA